MKKIVVFTGAGVSADSGLATFRDSDGLWANYRIEDVCTPEALRDNRAQVVDFYNMRRREMLGKEPNAGHRAIAGLEECFDVEVITQNVDNLHERAGSSRAGTADLMVVVGTSLAVYPAASLVRYVRPDVPIFLVDPGNPDTAMIRNPLTHIRSRAAEGMPELAERLKSEFS